jgi:very-short-patch-repair endonuclease
MKKYTTNEFIERAKNVHGEKYDYSKVKYVGALIKVTIICNEHGIFTQKAGDHLFGYGCPKCSNMYITTKKFIEKANLIHNNLYDYSKVNYVNANTKIIIVCKTHGEFLQRPNDHLSGSGCPHCKKSQGENLITEYLNEKNIDFEREKKFSNCKGVKRMLPFDFYLPKHNVLIEFDGEHHFKTINYWGGEEKLKKQEKTDGIKNDFAKSQNIGLLRIKYSDINNIKQLINNII